MELYATTQDNDDCVTRYYWKWEEVDSVLALVAICAPALRGTIIGAVIMVTF